MESKSSSSELGKELLKNDILHPEEVKEFERLYERFLSQQRRPDLDWNKVKQPNPSLCVDYDSMETCPNNAQLQHELLQKMCIVKLNGGLGSSMGCVGPKSALEVRNGLTFLDMTVRQVEYLNTKFGVDVPLILMNSFHTHEDTIKIVRKYASHNLRIACFKQSRFPRISKNHLTPLPKTRFSEETKHEWYPPGHGDIYRSLVYSGVLSELMKEGKEYLFISNVDNLGAMADLSILFHLFNENIEFCMEVTEKTRADTVGGTLVEYEGHARLVEMSQVPAAHRESFKDPKMFPNFNTNNLWVSCKAIERLVKADKIESEVIVTTKTVNGKEVLQLETAAGAAIRFFDKVLGVKVPRRRFLPVKSTSDLFLVQSNLFEAKHGTLVRDPTRPFDAFPLVKLGPEFKNVAEYIKRIPHLPDIKYLDHLTVSGNVRFGKNVTLKGTVIVVANEGARIDIPDGSVFENKVVTGNLRVLEH